MKDITLRIALFEKSKNKKTLKVRELLTIAFLFYLIIANFQSFFVPVILELKVIGTHLLLYRGFSYDDKMKDKVGPEYFEWTKLVRFHTDKSSLVFHPPQMGPWSQSGNPEFSQYFLFPAKLIREDRERIVTRKDISHVLIAWGEDRVEDSRLLGWPKFPVYAQKIYYLPQTRTLEVKGIDGLQEWIRDAERAMNYFDNNRWNITYTSSQYDYWIKDVNYDLTTQTIFDVEVKSNWLNSTALIARVDFGKDKFAMFSSSPNKVKDLWTTLSLSDLYSRAVQYAGLMGWESSNLKVSALGLNTGHPATMPYGEKWGVIEVEKGDKSRQDYLSKNLINSQNFMALGNISALNNDNVTALRYYQMAEILELSDPITHLGVADLSFKIGDKNKAEEEYIEAIRLDPDNSWFYYALGKFYQNTQAFSKAIEYYEQALSYYPESIWTNLSLGEVYESENKLELATRYYRLASAGPRRDFSAEGKIAWKKLKQIENNQMEIVKKAQAKLASNPNDWNERINLSRAYIILGNIDKATEQYKQAYQINPFGLTSMLDLPPNWSDQLSQPLHGKVGPALDVEFIDNKLVSALDNYHSYVRYRPDLFPMSKGTVEIKWRLSENFKTDYDGIINLIYQFNGFAVWLKDNKLHYGVYNQENKQWQLLESEPLSLSNNKWYRVGFSYGDQGMSLSLDGKLLAKNDLKGGINNGRMVYIGRGFLTSVGDISKQISYFDTVNVYDYQRKD